MAGSLTHSYPGQANDRSLQALMIPASSCQVDQNAPSEGNPFETQHSIGRFTPGSYEVLCPMPFNNIEMSGRRNDKDISKFRVTYKDGDGLDFGGELTVILQRITFEDELIRFTVVCSWSSNTDGSGQIGIARDVAPCKHDVRRQDFYVFVVILDRTSVEVSFYGIDFP